jgi:hypothetical protein
MVLFVGMIAVLIAANRRARKLAAAAVVVPAPLEVEPPASENSDANAGRVQ